MASETHTHWGEISVYSLIHPCRDNTKPGTLPLHVRSTRSNVLPGTRSEEGYFPH